MNTGRHAQAGTNLVEFMFLSALVGITVGVGLGVAHRSGWQWGLVAAVLTVFAVFLIYSLLYWGVGFLPYPLGKPKRPKRQSRADDADSSHVA